uniref:ATP-binding protein n=1 Tax=Schlesneria paludicola TaxID=360056 RepID=A0A7C4QPZ6_9PLAN
MQDYEKLGYFYLGRHYDLERRAAGEPLLYAAKDLCTHAVCVGMTGSGKTGLCLALLEEAAIDGIPALCIDPKGDLGNLLLTFPELKPSDFRPWIDPAEAARRGLTPEEFAALTAENWRKGLAEWNQPANRIARLQAAADFAIYTPGSQAGLPLTVLRSFSAPSEGDAEALQERIAAAVSGLLALLGINADPLQSREHILLSNLFDRAWRSGKDLDLGTLIRHIQSPPFDRLGVLDLESFFPAQERFNFALQLNSLLASPGFAAWREGEPLDVQSLLYTAAGKPRVSILSIAHLTEAERMFFVTILLNEVLAWVRRQPGTSSLRAILYMDEVFGFFPPTANPPSKRPMLTLLKQARAYGLGVLLATQNPVDLDYKGLSNCGTWFLGRLQTERDKLRVLDGLEGASAAAGAHFDRSRIERILSGLGSRVFLMNNVHEELPVVLQSRWALSYLRGPLTREQIQMLMGPRKAPAKPAPPTEAAPRVVDETSHPVLPPTITELFLRRRRELDPAEHVVYRAGLSGSARVHFENKSAGVDESRDVWFVIPAVSTVSTTVWDEALDTDEPLDCQPQPEEHARFAPLPAALARPKTYQELTTALKDHLHRTQRLVLHRCKYLKTSSRSGESEGEFRVRITQAVKEQRDLEVEKLRARYAPKLAQLHEQIRKAEQRLAKEKEQSSAQTMNTAIRLGASLLSAMFGRKLASASNVSRAATSVRAAKRAAAERQDVARAEDDLQMLQRRLADLNAEFEAEAHKLQAHLEARANDFEEIQIRPKKSDISVTQVALVWTPWIAAPTGALTPGWE